MHDATTHPGQFPTDTAGLPPAQPTPELTIADGERLDLRIAPVAQSLAGGAIRRLAYNGSVPGPTLRVKQGSEIVVHVTNDGDVDATVHWHGLRLENRYDGVPHETQRPIPVGGSFTYRVRFPDAGLYWYHPHIREDYAQDMGLTGAIVVEPAFAGYWPAADRDVVLTIDDLLLEDGQVVGYGQAGPDHVAMGRFGNVLLVNGSPDWTFEATRGEVVRLYLVNTANTRVFNVGLRGARMKLVGGDSGRVEHEAFVDSVIIAPSERAVVDVLFDRAGSATLEHRTPETTAVLGTVAIGDGGHRSAPGSGAADVFDTLRHDPELAAERARIEPDLRREPDKVLALVAEMDMGGPDPAANAAALPGSPRFACPMDPDVVSMEPARCPKCGMKLLPIQHVPAALELLAAAGPPSGDAGHSPAAGHSGHGDPASRDGIEWEDGMAAVNRHTTPANTRWMLVDRQAGTVNAAIDWSFVVGDRVKIRLVNELDSDHPMHHPFHIHGAGRFLVVARGGATEPNLVWKDTVLVRTGEIVDIVLDVSNPGLWMAHCHIAEHAESGMMFSFRVRRDTIDPGRPEAPTAHHDPGGTPPDQATMEAGMEMVTDPVCGMRIDPNDAVATVEHDGTTYYFCSQACHDAFVADPASYLD